ncbi:Major facilitator superfamily [Globisporangium polare]
MRAAASGSRIRSHEPSPHHTLDLTSAVATPNERAGSARAVPYCGTIQTPVDRSNNANVTELRLPEDDPPPPRRRQHQGTPSARRTFRRTFGIATDPEQNDKAREIRLCSAARPHMRAFHFAWLSFFVAFFGWFSIPPLMPTIKKELHLTSDQVANSNIAAVASTILGRVLTGPLCDRYGPRTVQAVLLLVGSIPVAAAALVTNYSAFVVVRFLIGLVGCSFIATTYWTSTMFCNEIVGRANALAAGWGNLGAGVTYLITPLIYDLITVQASVSDDTGWRLTLLLPPLFMVLIGVALYRFADDCPQGNYADLKLERDSEYRPVVKEVSSSIRKALGRSATWILAYQYACCFGVELIVHNVLSLYYFEDFKKADCDPTKDLVNKCRLLTQTTAALISSLFGLMCIFARAAGGYASDVVNIKHGMKGRIRLHLAAFACQAAVLYLYSRTTNLGWSIGYLVTFGFFVQACTGTTYAIVPYVLPHFTGATSGVVGAGGNLGAMCWGFLFKAVVDRGDSFQYMSIFVAIAAVLSPLIDVEDDRSEWTLENAGPYSQTPSEGGGPQVRADGTPGGARGQFVAYT